jgi:predicted transposase/invertase (TIGR01784 family)
MKIDEVLEKSKMLEVENMVYNLANTIDGMKKKAEVTGIEKGKIEVAKSALEKGADIDFVIKITGLDEDVVKKLKEEI